MSIWPPPPVLQAVWVLVVSLPVVFVNAPSTAGHPAVALWSRWTDEAGVAVWAVGMLAEVAADTQKFNWKDNPDNRGRWCQFGETICSDCPCIDISRTICFW